MISKWDLGQVSRRHTPEVAGDAPRIRRVMRGIARFLAETFRQVHDPGTAAGGEYIRAPGGRLKSWIDFVVPPFDIWNTF